MASARKGYIYILSNKTRSVLYTGVTADLKDRIWRHRQGEGSAFTSRYNVKYLLYVEEHETMLKAIEREKQLKNWNRAWKLDLIKSANPAFRDLWYDLQKAIVIPHSDAGSLGNEEHGFNF